VVYFINEDDPEQARFEVEFTEGVVKGHSTGSRRR
jgi:hypothetical protein